MIQPIRRLPPDYRTAIGDCDRPVECGKLMDDAALLIQDYEKSV